MMRKFLVPSLIFMFAASFAFSADPAANWTYVINPGSVDYLDVARSGLPPEIYFSGGNPRYWMALRHNESSGDYDQVYFSGFYSSDIVAVKVAEVTGDSLEDILVMTDDGRLRIYDQVDKSLTATITVPSSYYTRDMAVTDVDGDGAREIIICQSGHLYVYSTSGILEWDLDGVGGSKMVIAQMDGDPALEIATTDGFVIDSETHSIQWDWYYGFGSQLAATDIDGDGCAELIVAESSYLWAYDVDLQLPKWSIPLSYSSPRSILATDLDGDGTTELLLSQNGIQLLDPVTLQMEQLIPLSDSYVYGLAAEDVDADGDIELIWGDSNGLTIADWQTGLIEWETPTAYGPFIGPERGDLDGDGRDEIAVVYKASQYSGSGCGIMVLDAASRRLRTMSALIPGDTGTCYVTDLKLRDVNRDGRLEILTAAQYSGINIVRFNADNSLQLIWSSSSSSYFYSVVADDIDNDSETEIIGGASDGYVYVYDFSQNPGPLEWQSLYLRGTVRALSTADVDQDGMIELIAMVSSGDVYVFNGETRLLEGMIMGPFTAMQVKNMDGIPSIVLANSSEELMIYRYASGQYLQTYKRELPTSSIAAFTLDWRDHVWVSTGSSTEGLYEMTLDGSILETYSGYGSNFGQRVAVSRCARQFYTAGSYVFAAFPMDESTVCSPDLDGDGISDAAVWRPDTGDWYILRSGTPGSYLATHWGQATDKTVTADYDGDGRLDLAVWRPGNGTWYILPSLTPGSFTAYQWGTSAHYPVPGDYDGDGKADVAVWDPDSGLWYILSSELPGVCSATQWGMSTDIPVPADYDGDGETDIAVWRPGNGVWYILPSGSPGSYITIQWGLSTDIPVPADYDGDEDTDIAVWRPGNGVWYILPSGSPGSYTETQWGQNGDVTVPGDYDGDGKMDMAVWRPGNGIWYILPSSSSGSYTAVQWGYDTDVPISRQTGILGSLP